MTEDAVIFIFILVAIIWLHSIDNKHKCSGVRSFPPPKTKRPKMPKWEKV